MKPRALFVGRARYMLPLNDDSAAQVGRRRRRARLTVFSRRRPTEERATPRSYFAREPRSTGLRFWLTLPVAHSCVEQLSSSPQAIVAQSPFEAAAALLARPRVPVIVEVHGDWRTFARLYGSPSRRLLARACGRDRARAAVRRSAKVRTVSPYTTRSRARRRP